MLLVISIVLHVLFLLFGVFYRCVGFETRGTVFFSLGTSAVQILQKVCHMAGLQFDLNQHQAHHAAYVSLCTLFPAQNVAGLLSWFERIITPVPWRRNECKKEKMGQRKNE